MNINKIINRLTFNVIVKIIYHLVITICLLINKVKNLNYIAAGNMVLDSQIAYKMLYINRTSDVRNLCNIKRCTVPMCLDLPYTPNIW